jgi:hypothetical protein
MSDQQSCQQGNQLDLLQDDEQMVPQDDDHVVPQDDDHVVLQHNEQVVLQHDARFQAIILITRIFILLVHQKMMSRLAELNRRKRIPYHTSTLSGIDWVHELLSGHPERMRTELGVYRGTFIILVKALEKCEVWSSRHVSVEEQLSIFLYTAVTGLSCTHVGERFQRSSSTITK